MGISVNRPASGAGQITIATNGMGEPNWSYIPTAGKSGKSKSEFVGEIKELAQKAAFSCSKAESEQISRQVLRLRTEYLSEVAPDRRALYGQAKSAVRQQNSGRGHQMRGERILIDFLEEAQGRGERAAEEKKVLAGGGTLTRPILTGGGYGVEIECQGAKVLLNNGNGWSYEMTPAELARKDEFYGIYWDAYRAAKSAVDSGSGRDQAIISPEGRNRSFLYGTDRN